MKGTNAIGLAILAIVVLGITARAIYTSRTLEDLRRAEATNRQVREAAVEGERARLIREIQAVEVGIQAVQTEGDRRMRQAKAAEVDAAAKRIAVLQELDNFKKDHWVTRWVPGSDVSKHIVTLEGAAEGAGCAINRLGLVSRAANAVMNREVSELNQRKRILEREVAALEPSTSETVLPTWLEIFFGQRTPPVQSGPPIAAARLATPGVATFQFTYLLPDIHPTTAAVHKTDLFELLDIGSASELAKWLGGLGKQAQSEAIRIWKDKESGNLVDLTVGCSKVTLNRPVAEALWIKNQYFLAQTDYQCEIAPTSDFREYLKQRALKNDASKGGTPVAKPLDSKHVVGDAVDQSARCQSGSVPFDFDSSGRVIFVRMDGRGQAVHEPAVREAIVGRRRAEFAGDYKRLVESKGDVKAWEDAQYEVALHELLRFPPGTGVYGAHVMSFEAGLKAGLVGAFCGIRHDPIHSELSMGGSRAECGDKLNGQPACYRIDAKGEPDCWRDSPKWNEMVNAERKRSWGSQYSQLYGPERLERYLPKVASHAAGEGR